MFHRRGGGGAGVFVSDRLFISTRLDSVLKKLNFYYKKQFLKLFIYFTQSLPEIIYFKKTTAPPLWRLNGGRLIPTPRQPLGASQTGNES